MKMLLYADFSGQYNASKAAFNMLSETLRYELAPFDVRVITLLAGNVTSNLSSGNGAPPAELPATSRYKAVEKDIAAEVKFSEMETVKFAEEVVGAVGARATGRVWSGGNTWVLRWIVPVMPGFIYVSILESEGRVVLTSVLEPSYDLPWSRCG